LSDQTNDYKIIIGGFFAINAVLRSKNKDFLVPKSDNHNVSVLPRRISSNLELFSSYGTNRVKIIDKKELSGVITHSKYK